MLNWILFLILAIITYILFSVYGQISSAAGVSASDAVLKMFKLIPFIVMIAANIFWTAALYYGFLGTRFALSVLFASGVVLSFFYSAIFLGAVITFTKAAGIAFVLLGIYLLA